MIALFDIKGEFYRLASAYPSFLYFLWHSFRDNWLEPPEGVDDLFWFSTFTEILTAVLELRTAAQHLLLEVILDLTKVLKNSGKGYPTLHDVSRRLFQIAGESRSSQREIALRLAQRIHSTLRILGSTAAAHECVNWSKLCQYNWALNVAGLSGIIQILCALIYFAKALLHRTCNALFSAKLETLFVLDECSLLFPRSATKKSSILVRIIQRARAFGIGVIFATQDWQIDPAILANTSLKCCVGGFGDGTDFEQFGSAVGLNRAQRDFHRTLKRPGSAVCSELRHPTPFTVQIDPPIDLGCNMTSDQIAALSERSARILYGEDSKSTSGTESPPERAQDKNESVANDTATSALRTATALNPQSGNDRYADIALSILRAQLTCMIPFPFRSEAAQLEGVKGMATLQKAEKAALAQGSIEKLYLPRGKTNVCLWRPLPSVYRALGVSEPQWSSKGGYLHKFCAHRIKATFESDGWNGKIEYRLANGKLVDLACWKRDSYKLIECCASYPLEKELVNLSLDTEQREGERVPDELVFAVTDRRMKEPLTRLIADYLAKKPLPFPVRVVLAGDLIKPLELS